MLASYRGHIEIVELLLLYDSDVNLTTQVKNTNDNYYAYIHSTVLCCVCYFYVL